MLVFVFLALCTAAQAQDATCRDLYDQMYESCFMGGVEIGPDGCAQMVQMLGPALMSEEQVSGFSAALSVSICKKGCEDAAGSGKRMPFSAFKREFCGRQIK
jgi:uncharacterized protein with von Willebrand factor type A (vWA) domain